jgi:hypothetical protein
MKRISLRLRDIIASIAIGILLGVPIAAANGCAHTTPGQFTNAVVTCTLDNTSNPQAGAAVLSCLTAAVAGNYSACLAGLVTAGQWTVEEVACIVRNLSTQAAQKLNAGDKSGENQLILDNANQWLRDNSIRFR